MTRRLFLIICSLGLACAACGEEADPADEEIVPIANEVAPSAPAPVIAPQHGGTVVPVGPYPVEVLGRGDTGVEAFFLGDDVPAPGGVELTVTVPTSDGDRPVVLVWDPRQARFRGVVPGASLAGGAIEVVVASDGQAYRGTGPALIVIQSPVSAAVAPPPVAVGPRPPAPRPTVVVHRPVVERPGVVVVAPSRPGVVIEGPRHHSRRVGRGPRHHRGRGRHRRRRGRRH